MRARAAQTLSPEPRSLPERALSRVVFPEEGGPSSSVRRPGRMAPLRPLRMLMRFLVLRMILSRCSRPCSSTIATSITHPVWDLLMAFALCHAQHALHLSGPRNSDMAAGGIHTAAKLETRGKDHILFTEA